MARAQAPTVASGPGVVDRTPGTIPADLAALETAVPAAGQPAGEQWTAAYGVAPDIQFARVIGGVWAGADVDATATPTTHLTDTAVGPATAGQPTEAEIGTAAGAVRDAILTYTGTDNPADPVSYAYYIDTAGSVTTLLSPMVATGAMSGATQAAAGTGGSVPVPAAGRHDLVLHGDALWRQIVPNWTANTEFSTGAIVFQGSSVWRRNLAGLSGLTFDATEQAEWTELADVTDPGRTLHNAAAAGPTALSRINSSYQGEIHVEAPFGWTIDGAAFEDGDYFLAVNTAGAAVLSSLVPSNFVGAFLRDGTSTNILAGVDLGSEVDARWVITVTENAGNKFLNVYPFGSPADIDRFTPTVDTQTLTVGEKYAIGAAHTVTLPPLSAATEGQYITMVAPAAWNDLTGAINPTGGDTLEPATGLPMGSRDILTLVDSFSTGQWLVRVGGDPVPEFSGLAFDTVALLPDPATVTAGTRASVTDDGALTGVYVASGPTGAPGTGWTRS